MSKSEYQKEYRLKNKEKLREYNLAYQKQYYLDKSHMYTFWQVRARAKKLGLPFDITPEDCIPPEVCPILGIPLFRNHGENKPSANSPSLDRIVPSEGYVKGNVQVISQRANIMKNDASIEELRRFADWVKTLTHL